MTNAVHIYELTILSVKSSTSCKWTWHTYNMTETDQHMHQIQIVAPVWLSLAKAAITAFFTNLMSLWTIVFTFPWGEVCRHALITEWVQPANTTPTHTALGCQETRVHPTSPQSPRWNAVNSHNHHHAATRVKCPSASSSISSQTSSGNNCSHSYYY